MKANHDLKSILQHAAIDVTDAQLAQLEKYRQLVATWNPRQNLVAPSTLPDFNRRHLLDSAQLTAFLPKATSSIIGSDINLLDIGSGAGLPGMVLAILCPHFKITLAEIIQKKASFLTTAAYELGVKNVRVHAADVRTLEPEKFNFITARAVTNLADLLDLSENLLADGGCWLLLKGQAVEHEINALKILSNLTITQHRSIVSPDGVVLAIKRAN